MWPQVQCECICGRLTQAGEIFVVENGASRRASTASTGSTTAGSTATRSTARSAVTTATTLTATTATTIAATVAPEAATAAALTRLTLPGTVPLDNVLLGLLLLLLAALLDRGGVVSEVFLLDGNQGLLLLGALIGLAELLGSVKTSGSAFFVPLGQVLVEGELLGLRLLRFGLSILSLGGLLLALSNGFSGLLILQLGVAISGAPRLGSLLLGATTIFISWMSRPTEGAQMGCMVTYGAMFLACRSSALR